jgi:hypothetical protein
MIMRLAVIAVCSLAIAVAMFAPLRSQDQKAPRDGAPTEKEISIWMHQKSSLSQRVMQGLTEGDFEKVRKSAVLMNVLSYFEGRAHSDDPEYKRQLGHFDFANRELVRMAKAENLEGATLAYNQLTVSCVYCHKTLREKTDGR